jgi:predicted DNA-binding transcriptional regulator AlpA
MYQVGSQRPRRYLNTKQVLNRYGGKSEMWLWRIRRNDSRFPRPLVIGQRNLFLEEALDEFDDTCREEALGRQPESLSETPMKPSQKPHKEKSIDSAESAEQQR